MQRGLAAAERCQAQFMLSVLLRVTASPRSNGSYVDYMWQLTLGREEAQLSLNTESSLMAWEQSQLCGDSPFHSPMRSLGKVGSCSAGSDGNIMILNTAHDEAGLRLPLRASCKILAKHCGDQWQLAQTTKFGFNLPGPLSGIWSSI